MRLVLRWIAVAALAAASITARADGTLIKVPTRDGVNTSLYWEEAVDAKATVLLFPGGGGGFGKVEEGRATGQNFLVRSARYFVGHGFNVAIFGRPDDATELDHADRIADPHLMDVRKVLDFVKTRSAAPVWLVGTSRGTVSATAAAIHLQGDIQGLVLTSSVVGYRKPGAVPKQNLSAIEVPVLVLHHSKDACIHCQPHEVPGILRGLKNAPVKKQIILDGGDNPSGDECAALHWHGFVGMEREAVGIISAWIKQPAP